jgi:hypothetical protein
MLLVAYAASGQVLDFFCYDAAGNVWNGSAYVTAPTNTAGSPVAYRIPATEAPAFRYTATAPAGCYGYDLRVRAATWLLSVPADGTPGVNVVAVDGVAVVPATARTTVVKDRPPTVVVDN